MKCRIKINTKQYDENGKSDKIETIHSGEFYNKNNEIYVVYKEKQEDKNITNTIKINEDMLSMIKYGSTTSTMIFKDNSKTTTKYKTSYGMFLIDILTNKLEIEKKENHIKVFIEYNIDIKDLFTGKNEVSISIEIL